MTQNKEILVDKDEEPIRLDQLLKLHGIATSGGAAKHMIQSGDVKVNGEVETRRGRKLKTGDRIEALIHMV